MEKYKLILATWHDTDFFENQPTDDISFFWVFFFK